MKQGSVVPAKRLGILPRLDDSGFVVGSHQGHQFRPLDGEDFLQSGQIHFARSLRRNNQKPVSKRMPGRLQKTGVFHGADRDLFPARCHRVGDHRVICFCRAGQKNDLLRLTPYQISHPPAAIFQLLPRRPRFAV